MGLLGSPVFYCMGNALTKHFKMGMAYFMRRSMLLKLEVTMNVTDVL